MVFGGMSTVPGSRSITEVDTLGKNMTCCTPTGRVNAKVQGPRDVPASAPHL